MLIDQHQLTIKRTNKELQGLILFCAIEKRNDFLVARDATNAIFDKMGYFSRISPFKILNNLSNDELTKLLKEVGVKFVGDVVATMRSVSKIKNLKYIGLLELTKMNYVGYKTASHFVMCRNGQHDQDVVYIDDVMYGFMKGNGLECWKSPKPHQYASMLKTLALSRYWYPRTNKTDRFDYWYYLSKETGPQWTSTLRVLVLAYLDRFKENRY